VDCRQRIPLPAPRKVCPWPDSKAHDPPATTTSAIRTPATSASAPSNLKSARLGRYPGGNPPGPEALPHEAGVMRPRFPCRPRGLTRCLRTGLSEDRTAMETGLSNVSLVFCKPRVKKQPILPPDRRCACVLSQGPTRSGLPSLNGERAPQRAPNDSMFGTSVAPRADAGTPRGRKPQGCSSP
jgi:hypothetical protein